MTIFRMVMPFHPTLATSLLLFYSSCAAARHSAPPPYTYYCHCLLVQVQLLEHQPAAHGRTIAFLRKSKVGPQLRNSLANIPAWERFTRHEQTRF